MSKSKGDRYERRFVTFLDDAEFAVMRSPSSGSATTRDQPDVLAVRPEVGIAAEVKYVGKGSEYTYLDEEELEALERFAERVGARPRVVGRWYRDGTFYVVEPDALRENDTPQGNYRLDRDVETVQTLSDGGAGVTPVGLSGYIDVKDAEEVAL